MTTRREIRLSISVSALVLFLSFPLCAAAPLEAAPFEALAYDARALVLDLDGDGLRLSDRYYPVRYDLDGDGRAEVLSWTAGRQNEAFLWHDANGNGFPDNTHELLRSFRELAEWDRPVLGGDGDGALTARDRRWSELGLWIDHDHDAVPTATELSHPDDWGVFEIGLIAGQGLPMEIDGGLNLLARRSPCRRWDPRRSRRVEWEATLVEVVFDRRPAPQVASQVALRVASQVASQRTSPRTRAEGLPPLPVGIPSAVEPGI